ncbi:FemAB family XrtA/PEP-CTERM system-associated protein [Catenovulum adriaticum]|uniref:FemAB family PEP-CTERM system-associated protein n=1 Tax=Catenovulum adriaticum TaxID=2984846 RepID=A0ABY7AMC7_9ALTE|nr:FemAB family XrtA/PEP-CTERM system-associated protein [Catenovulum sp. TS8]WAJ70708.1 FemAB family PEP-CTERM system-associated protein [Catenovulum sp. TS8]
MASIQKLAVNSNSEKWDQFVHNHPEGTFFHLAGWQNVIHNTYQHKCWYLYSEDEKGNILGVLPLVELKSKLFGHSLVSTPFCVYGGVIAESNESKQALEEHAIELAKELNVDYLELRYQAPQHNDKFLTKSMHSYFTYELGETDEAILAGIKKKQRAVIRHALKEPLTTNFDAKVTHVHDIYAESVRNLGTPVFPAKYFKNLKQEFGEQCELMTVESNNKAVSAVMSFYYKNEVLPYYGGGLSEARQLKSNDLMYYALMCHAANNKQCTRFDFGRSKNDSGAYKYKKHWGMEPQPLYYQYYLVKATELPNLSPNNPKYKMFIKMWQKLPLWASQKLGPFLSKYLG